MKAEIKRIHLEYFFTQFQYFTPLIIDAEKYFTQFLAIFAPLDLVKGLFWVFELQICGQSGYWMELTYLLFNSIKKEILKFSKILYFLDIF